MRERNPEIKKSRNPEMNHERKETAIERQKPGKKGREKPLCVCLNIGNFMSARVPLNMGPSGHVKGGQRIRHTHTETFRAHH